MQPPRHAAWVATAILAAWVVLPGPATARARKAPPQAAAAVEESDGAIRLDPARAKLDPGPGGRMGEVIDGVGFVLVEENGNRPAVRLVGLRWPETERQREAARQALRGLIQDIPLRLYFGGRRADRYGRFLAHVVRADGTWVQGEMLRLGMAGVETTPDNRALGRELLALEAAARAARRGIWADAQARPLAVEETARHLGQFVLVEGRVTEAKVVKGRGYLNFGEDWRRDFTVSVAPRPRRLFTAAGLDIESLAGKRVRVRGWLDQFNGPMIEADHPEQIEVLE